MEFERIRRRSTDNEIDMANYMRVDYEAIDWIQYTELGRYKPPIIVDRLVMSVLDAWR